jgi:phenylacetate-CoA ligase
MAFFHLRTMPGHDWPAVPNALLSQVWAAYLELNRNQWGRADDIALGQLTQLRTLLTHAMVHVPYYHRVLSEAGIVPGEIRTLSDFCRVPRLKRATCQDNVNDLTAARLPAGTVATGQAATAGSRGRPITALQTNITDLWWHACYLRDLEWCGIDPVGSVASIRNTKYTGTELRRVFEGIRAPCWLPHLDGLIETGPAYGMDVNQDPRLQLRWLERVSPDYLLGYPSNLRVLASLSREEGVKLSRLRAIQTVSETLTDDARQELESIFCVPVKSIYSCNEGGYVASACPSGTGWHVHSENVLLEVVNEKGEPCHPRESGTVLLTALHNLRSPFIRYEVGDVVTLGDPCPCGRGLPLLLNIQGKSPAVFRLAKGRSKSSYGLSSALRRIGGFHQCQTVQRALDQVVLRIVPAADWSEDHDHEIRRCIDEFFEVPVRIDLQMADRLELTAGGKFESMICEC